jgi:probable rRNA maturation factor
MRTMADPKLDLSLQFAVKKSARPRRSKFRRWAKAALLADAEVALRVVGEDEARALNREYRGKDYATNVLTFVYGGEPLHPQGARRFRKAVKPPTAPLTGDIVICAPVVAREAVEQGISLEAHYAHLTLHGMLHLQGYDHESDAEAVTMEAVESFIMRRLGYADPYSDSDADTLSVNS